MWRSALLLLAFSTLAACGDRPAGKQGPESAPFAVVDAEQANLALLVSNQSPVDPRVDLEIRVGGQIAVEDTYDVGRNKSYQHHVFWYHLRLAPGPHEVTATAKGGAIGASQTVTLDGPRWVSVNYWRDAAGPGKEKGTGRLQIEVSAEPMKIE